MYSCASVFIKILDTIKHLKKDEKAVIVFYNTLRELTERMIKHSYLAEMIKAKASGDNETSQQEARGAKRMTMQIIAFLDHVAHPFDAPIIVAALEQYVLLKKSRFTKMQLNMVSLMRETFQLQEISMILPTQNNGNEENGK